MHARTEKNVYHKSRHKGNRTIAKKRTAGLGLRTAWRSAEGCQWSPFAVADDNLRQGGERAAARPVEYMNTAPLPRLAENYFTAHSTISLVATG